MYKGKGIIFVGCSFTWGGGLEYYAPFEDIPNPYAYQFDESKISFATMNFIKANRFSRLVAKHFEMWEVNKLHCGGSDDNSIFFLENCFSLNNQSETTPNKHYENINNQKFSSDEIKCVVFQLTHPMRNYKEILKNEKFLSDTFDTWEEMENHFILENLKGVIKIFEQLESMGIACKLWCSYDDYSSFIKKHNYLSPKLITLKYLNEEFNSLYDLMDKHPKFKISTSGFLLNGKPVPDDHQTIECHKIIADSIINSLEKDNINQMLL
jgi:hypothetical protein